MSRFEQRYNWTADILAWGHEKYNEEGLKALTMPELFEVHSQAYFQHVIEMQTIHG